MPYDPRLQGGPYMVPPFGQPTSPSDAPQAQPNRWWDQQAAPRRRGVDYAPPAQQGAPLGLLDMMRMGQAGQAIGRRVNRPIGQSASQSANSPNSPPPASPWAWLGR